MSPHNDQHEQQNGNHQVIPRFFSEMNLETSE